jgi:hypothetical protein
VMGWGKQVSAGQIAKEARDGTPIRIYLGLKLIVLPRLLTGGGVRVSKEVRVIGVYSARSYKEGGWRFNVPPQPVTLGAIAARSKFIWASVAE